MDDTIIEIDQDVWSKALAGEYTATITFTAEVLVDGVSCKQTGDLQIQRGTTPQITVKSAGGAVLRTAILNEEDITEELGIAVHGGRVGGKGQAKTNRNGVEIH